MRRLLLLPGLLIFTGCAGPVKSLFPPRSGEATRTIHVVSHGGLHTGIAVTWADIPTDLWPARLDYPGSRHLEVGWGDDDGYRKDLTPWIVLKALFWPTRSVLQLDGFTNSITRNFDDPRCVIIEITISERGFRRLCEHISQSHALDETGQPLRLGNDWYQARNKYCLIRTCNTWVASALRKAGCPISPAYCISRGPLLYQAKKFGRVIAPLKRDESPKSKRD